MVHATMLPFFDFFTCHTLKNPCVAWLAPSWSAPWTPTTWNASCCSIHLFMSSSIRVEISKYSAMMWYRCKERSRARDLETHTDHLLGPSASSCPSCIDCLRPEFQLTFGSKGSPASPGSPYLRISPPCYFRSLRIKHGKAGQNRKSTYTNSIQLLIPNKGGLDGWICQSTEDTDGAVLSESLSWRFHHATGITAKPRTVWNVNFT